ncbi:MAG TPA: hemolysin family protein, partial [Roseiflexaceae bacterium]|nr:hemolysin family protein [Roseiflexaceae bacterium]
NMLANLSGPVIAILNWSTEGLLRLLGRHESGGPNLTEEDIRQVLREGTETGVVTPDEHNLIESVFAFSSRITRRIMTPRNQVVGFDAAATIDEVVDAAVESGFSRFPIFERRPDQICGVVHVRDLLRAVRAGQQAAGVSTLMRPVLNVPETVQVADLMSTFRRTRNHLAVVIDEHGSVEGIVTMEDALEELVGEIDDEHDVGEEPLFAERPDGSLLIDGGAPIERVAERLALQELPTYADDHYDTLAGMLLSLFGSIPRKGDRIHYENWQFEIVDMDGLRIDQVLVTPHAPPYAGGSD